MKNISYFGVVSSFFIVAFLLAACGEPPSQTVAPAKGPKVEANVVAFTGDVQAIHGTEWTISGHMLTVDPQALLDPNISVGDRVKVHAKVFAHDVVAMKVEPSPTEDSVFDALADVISTPDPVERPQPGVSSVSDAGNSSDVFIPRTGADMQEVFGMVEEITADTITVDGVIYGLTSFTRIRDVPAVGDLVKFHVTVDTDGTFIVREIEKSASSYNDNSSNSGGNTEAPTYDATDDNSHRTSSKDGSQHDSNGIHRSNSGKSGSGGE